MDENWRTIPSLNDAGCTTDSCKNRIVRCRMLVQDILDKEFYNGMVEEVDSAGNRRTLHTKYQDSINCTTPDCYIDFDSSASIILERQPVVCVPIPGESLWVKDVLDDRYSGCCGDNNNKRTHDQNSGGVHALAGRAGMCVVKFYSAADSLFHTSASIHGVNASKNNDADWNYATDVKLQDMVEIIGIYTLADTKADMNTDGCATGNKAMRVDAVDASHVSSSFSFPSSRMDDDSVAFDEESAHSQAQSQPQPLPHIHCLYAKKCSASFPLPVFPSASSDSNHSGTLRGLLLNFIAASIFSSFTTVHPGPSPLQLPIVPGAAGNWNRIGPNVKLLNDIQCISKLILLCLLSNSSAGVTTDETGMSGMSDMIIGYLPLNLVIGNLCADGDLLWTRLKTCVAALVPRTVSVDRLDTHLFDANPSSPSASSSASAASNSSFSQSSKDVAASACLDTSVGQFFSTYVSEVGCDVEDFGMDVAGADGECEVAEDPVDIKARRCSPSILQAGAGTVCLFNELFMHAGSLSVPGDQALRALRTFCNRQQATVVYNEYTSLSLPVNHPVLSLSRCRSVLLQDPYTQPVHVENYSALCTAFENCTSSSGCGTTSVAVEAKTLLDARMYLLSAAALNASDSAHPISMAPVVVESAEQFFLQCRRQHTAVPAVDGTEKTSAVNWFHFCLTLVRLIACSHQEIEINMEHWNEMLELASWTQDNFINIHNGSA